MPGAVLRAGVPARPRHKLGKGDVESLAALKQALQPARARMGTSAPSREASLGRAEMPSCPLEQQKGDFQVLLPAGPSAQSVRECPAPCATSRFLFGGIQLNPKSSVFN